MGQCGCGDLPIENGYQLPSGEIIAYAIYRGCDECHAGPAVDIFIYPNKKSEWIRDAKIETYKPDEYGGNQGHGIPIAFFEVRDLVAAAKAIGGTTLSKDGYDSVESWLEDYGLQMMQDAMRLFEKRVEALMR
jgi:hypothetical protein